MTIKIQQRQSGERPDKEGMMISQFSCSSHFTRYANYPETLAYFRRHYAVVDPVTLIAARNKSPGRCLPSTELAVYHEACPAESET